MTGEPQSYMLKEIYEQPDAIERTIAHHLSNDGLASIHEDLKHATKIIIAASGSSRHAGLAGEIIIEDIAEIPTDVEYSSEYCYRRPRVSVGYIVVAITQSGETGDTIAAQREAIARGAKTIAIANVEGSTIAREAAAQFLTYAGKEVSIPATKSFTSQLTALYLFAIKLAELRGVLTPEQIEAKLAALQHVPGKIRRYLRQWQEATLPAAKMVHGADRYFYLGRGVHYPIAREGALKLKEISYAHAEGYPAGELRHGPTALVDSSLPVVLLATRDPNDEASSLRYEKTLAIASEVKAKSAPVIAVATEGDEEIGKIADHVLYVPETPELLLPIVEVVPLQFLAYHIATLNGLDVDKPRNLVKAVLVE